MRETLLNIVLLQYSRCHRQTTFVIAKNLGGRSLPVLLALAFAKANEAGSVIGIVAFELHPGIMDSLIVNCDIGRDTNVHNSHGGHIRID